MPSPSLTDRQAYPWERDNSVAQGSDEKGMVEGSTNLPGGPSMEQSTDALQEGFVPLGELNDTVGKQESWDQAVLNNYSQGDR